jgi:hypothetical protein
MKTYAISNLPVVHKGFREVLNRLAVSSACLAHSTDETHEQIIVESCHVQMAKEFLERVYDLLELKAYKQEIEGGLKLSDQELAIIIGDLDQDHITILNSIRLAPKTSDQLAEVIQKNVRTVRRRIATLKRHRLVTTSSKGTTLTSRGIMFLKLTLLPKVDNRTNPVLEDLTRTQNVRLSSLNANALKDTHARISNQ